MDFVIYSLGSAEYLAQVLGAVSAITGSGDFTTLIQIGMVLGILILGFQSIMNGGKEISVGQIAAAFLLYAAMFGPTVDVGIKGVYDNDTYTVGDVPLGIAAPGSMVSQMGMGLTEMFELAFSPLTASTSPTGLSNGGGFVDSLKILNAVRRSGANTGLLSAVDEAQPGLRQSWDAYLKNCTSQKIVRGQTTIEEVYDAPFDDVKGIPFKSNTITTPYYESGGPTSPVNETCTSAYPQLIAWTDTLAAGSGLDDLLRRLIKPEGHSGPTAPPTPSSEVNSALDMLGQNTESSQDFIKLSILEPIFVQSMGDRYKDFLDNQTAIMVNQALDQRNVQWASEQTMFMSLVRPMMTFIEGFAYSIMPFAAFILVLGAMGMKLAIKYGQMLLWIQLWLPVLAMTNLYLHSVVTTELGEINNISTSFYALDQADKRLAHWISVGGMLAASTPILTLVLLTGSAYAMTSLASRMQGADHVNEKVASPDAVSPGALMQAGSMYQHSAGAGRTLTGAEGSLFNFDIGKLSQSSIQSARQEQAQASQSLMGSVTQGYKEGETLTSAQGRTEAFNSALSSTSSEGVSAVNDTASQMQEAFGLSQSQTQQLRAELAGNASMGASLGPKGNLGSILGKFGISASAAASQGFSHDQSVSETLQNTSGAGWSQTDTAALAESLSQQLQGTSQEQLAETWGSERASAMQSSASEVASSSETYQELQQASESIGSTESFRADRLGNMITDSGMASSLNSYFNMNATSEQKQAAAERADRYGDEDVYGMASNDAKAAAQMYELYNGNQEQQAAFLGILGGASGGNYGDNIPGSGASENEGVAGEIASPIDAGGGAYQSIPEPTNHLGPHGDAALVRSHHDANADRVEAQHGTNEQDQADNAISSRLDGVGDYQSTWAGNKLTNAVLGESTVANSQGGFPEAADRVLPANSGGFFNSNDNTGAQMIAQSMVNDPQSSSGMLPVVASSMGMSEGQAEAFGYGAMTSEQQQAFESQGGNVSLNTPAEQAAFSAGQAYQQGGLASAQSTFDQGRVQNAQEVYTRQYDSVGVGTVAAALHTSDANQRSEMFQAGIQSIASEAAASEGVDYHSLSSDDQTRYNRWGAYVADSVATGVSSQERGGALRAAKEHSQIVRMSK